MRSDPLQAHLKRLIKDDRDVSQLRAESSALLCDVTRAFVLELAERLVRELRASGNLSPDAFKAMLLAEPAFAPLHGFIQDMTVLETKAMLRKRKKAAPTAAASDKRAKLAAPAPEPEPVVDAPVAIAEDDDYDASD
ncbi:hypothetical protein SPRG_09442 [Saprolegnia parasitica CBS 223.65]|uniref:Transcription factor CBF/NF-Y/archaeal histone domain-containing protein n=1 Tax=Saprolegnia parasitica (strain CBS 223.65) TaxID=695850 RepID=A0A067C3U9_SAPPC|nr:hypothetical protein SPRG_09442 [Saprolegnia parasitica CBS 223.65]KDO25168.1 hypothetical protein SPRG_09442 [Saprolegnia parasitica CBS 223.65]|eukprot:XP_012204034.1 hypothetical protein SPRG_09442 [Saprolegnia parasitica CBS 223.65]